MFAIKFHNDSDYLCFKTRNTIMISKVIPFIISVSFWSCFCLFFESDFNLFKILYTVQNYLSNVLFNLIVLLFATAIYRLALASTTTPPEDLNIIVFPTYMDIYNHWWSWHLEEGNHYYLPIIKLW